MHVLVTRPEPAAERTAAALLAHGHDVWKLPLMSVEPIAADLSGGWGGIIITSANVPAAIAANPARVALLELPLYAVGARSAEAARTGGFTNVTSAGGDVRDLVRLLRGRKADATAPLLYLAGEDRAADLIGELAAHGIAAEIRVVYRAVAAPFPDELIAALESGDVQAVLHFSKRSADNYLAGAREAGIAEQALAVRHYCLSAQVAAPLEAAGAKRVAVARRPEEAALIELLPLSPA
ncbi:MAG TPA: uroporphyrinogen-III synthase [Pseudolabrys sp.]|nr:uroporphyrinogen-III synthase [Pseudolabrys sp.]